MTSPDNPEPSREPGAVSLDELAQSHAALRRLFQLQLLLLLLFAVSVAIYFLREVVVARRQIRDLSAYVANYEKTSLPVMLEFRTKLYNFAKENPDFMTIFTKYFNPTNPPSPLGDPAAPPQMDDVPPPSQN